MKIPSFFNYKKSIATRLTWRILGVMMVISILLSGLVIFLVWLLGVGVLAKVYETAIEVSNEKISNVFSVVETAVSNNTPEVKENLDVAGREFFPMERLLQLNPNIIGAAIALNPNYEPKRGIRFSPYVYRDSTGIKTKMLNSSEYDYLSKEWYVAPVSEKKSIWTEPYVDVGGGEVLMTTFSLPLINEKGEVIAVTTADVALDWIADFEQEIDSVYNNDYYWDFVDGKSNSYSFIVTRKGNFIAHPDKSMVFKKTIFDFFKNTDDTSDDEIANDIVSGKNGVSLFKQNDGSRYLVFYKPIKRMGWSLGVMLPVSELFVPINYLIRIFLIIMLFGLIIMALVCRRTIHRLTKPLTHFADSADEISKGNFQAELPVIKTQDEMLRLRNSFEMMQHSLVSQIEQIKAVNEEKGRFEGELLIARSTQMNMLPKIFPAFPDRMDVDVYALMKPAREVGGDLYDYLIRDEKLYFCVGDVSGKGIPASLVMTVTMALFRTASAHDSVPGRIVSGINDLISSDNESDMFVTLFVGVLDLPTGRLRYCNAGHDAPILIGDSGVGMLPCDANLPAGVLGGYKYTNQETTISPQTTIFLYTDGLTEAENVDHVLFDHQGVLDVVGRSERTPKVLISDLEQAVSEFVGNAEQSDDLTMLAIQYTKPMEQDVRLQRSISFANDLDLIPELAVFVEEVCEALDFDMETMMSLNLAVEEVVVNVMSYAYPENTKGDVTIEALATDHHLKIVVRDRGIPFDPTTKSEIDTTLSAEERQIGGLGIHLVRQIMDSINYERVDNQNVLTLIKKLS